jgi:phasin family protein
MATGPETTKKKDVDPTTMADEVAESIKEPTKTVDDVAEAIKQFNLPGVDVESLVASQKKNMEAVTSANQVAFQGLQAVAKRQAEILQEMMEEASTAVASLSKAGSPPEIAATSAELTKSAFERALANMKQLAELVTKTSEEITNTINTRILAGFDEIKEIALKARQQETTSSV